MRVWVGPKAWWRRVVRKAMKIYGFWGCDASDVIDADEVLRRLFGQSFDKGWEFMPRTGKGGQRDKKSSADFAP